MNTPLTRSTRQLLAAAALATIALLPASGSRAHAQSDSALETGVAAEVPGPDSAETTQGSALASSGIVFLSDRPGDWPSGTSQVWLKGSPDSAQPPVALTREPTGARSPVWFPKTAFGGYVAYVTRDGAGQDVIKILRSTDPGAEPWVYANAAADLGTERIDYLTWSPNGMKLCFAHYNQWHTRGLACLVFPTHAKNPHPNFPIHQVQPVVPVNLNPAPSESAFSSDSQTIYFSGDKGSNRGFLYRVSADATPATVWSSLRLLRDNQSRTIRQAFAPSVGSVSGYEVLIFNSEAYAKDPKRGEELMMLDLATGELTELTQVPGHQYGSFVRGSGLDFAMQSSADLTSADPQHGPKDDIFLGDIYGSPYRKVDLADPGNGFSDYAPDWIW